MVEVLPGVRDLSSESSRILGLFLSSYKNLPLYHRRRVASGGPVPITMATGAFGWVWSIDATGDHDLRQPVVVDRLRASPVSVRARPAVSGGRTEVAWPLPAAFCRGEDRNTSGPRLGLAPVPSR